jgi:hypothetical protein
VTHIDVYEKSQRYRYWFRVSEHLDRSGAVLLPLTEDQCGPGAWSMGPVPDPEPEEGPFGDIENEMIFGLEEIDTVDRAGGADEFSLDKLPF